MAIRLIYICFALLFMNHMPAFSVSLKFIKRGLKHCTDHCESGNINCSKGVNKQGYYDWCKANCLHEKKIDREKFVSAIAECDLKQAPVRERLIGEGRPLIGTPPETPRETLTVLPSIKLNAPMLTPEIKKAFEIMGLSNETTYRELNDKFGELDRRYLLGKDSQKRAELKRAYEMLEAAFVESMRSSQ